MSLFKSNVNFFDSFPMWIIRFCGKYTINIMLNTISSQVSSITYIDESTENRNQILRIHICIYIDKTYSIYWIFIEVDIMLHSFTLWFSFILPKYSFCSSCGIEFCLSLNMVILKWNLQSSTCDIKNQLWKVFFSISDISI